MSIQHWPQQEQPRQRLLKQGAEALSDAELLAIILRHGTRGKSALDLARSLLSHFHGLRGILHSSQQNLCNIPGLGPAKYCQLQAAFELSRRYLQEKLEQPNQLHTSQHAQQFIISNLRGHTQEVVAALFLDNNNGMLHFEKLFHGTINNATIHPREIIKRALKYNAAKIILAHNHPSGNAEPSQADQLITQSLKRTLTQIDITLIDHIIVGHNSVTSLAERGLC